MKTKIHPQYVDESMASKELQACVAIIDSIVELEEARGIGIHDCLRKALQWCNGRSHFIMAEMDRLDHEGVSI